ncbi:MAG: S-adenosylmethionine decarboxylase [Azospirillaceae bacterium]
MIIRQGFAELRGCGAAISDEAALRDAAVAAARSAGATVIGDHAQRYAEHGLTLVIFLAQSHVMLSTWPEYDLILADVLLCDDTMSVDGAIDALAARLCPDGTVVRSSVERRIGPAETRA